MNDQANAEVLVATLRRVFGHDDFLPGQREIVECVVAGGDALVMRPTGAGKSLCYQLPALLLPHPTLVLSPLIALMQDQTTSLRERGVAATFINSTLDRAEREKRLADLAAGRVRILFVTPERFRKEEFRRAVQAIRFSLLAVDEAHCVSAWGHDFRPEYGNVGAIRELLGRPVTIALTATATPDCRADILRTLRIEGARVFDAGIDRPNLTLGVTRVDDAVARRRRVLELVKSLPRPGIVYVTLIRELLVLETELQRAGIRPIVYHGELSPSEKRAAQRQFDEDDGGVVLATNAFGLGIDKPNVRYVVHAQAPGSLEAYFQEAGRAGRDGLPAACELVYHEDDLAVQMQFTEWANPSPSLVREVADWIADHGDTAASRGEEGLRRSLALSDKRDPRPLTALELLRASGVVLGTFEDGDLRALRRLESGEDGVIVDPEKRRRDLLRLYGFVSWVNAGECRKALLADYFGVARAPVPCGACDVCGSPRLVAASVATADDRDAAPSAPTGVARGDWIEIAGRGVYLVMKAESRGRRLTVTVEDPETLAVESFDLSRRRWSKLS